MLCFLSFGGSRPRTSIQGDATTWKQHCEALDALPASLKACLSHILGWEVA